MLDQAVEDSTNPKGWLDDIGSVLSDIFYPSALYNLEDILLQFDFAISNARSVNDNPSIFLELRRENLSLLLRQGFDCGFDCFAVLFKLGSKFLLVEINLPLLNSQWLAARLSHHQWCPSPLRV